MHNKEMKLKKTVAFSVSKNDAGLRLDQALAKAGFTKSRSQAAKWIQSQKVKRLNQPLRASHKVKPGEIFSLQLSDEKETPSISKEPIECLYEDEEILVIDKPAGIVTHPAPGHETDTLVNRLIYEKKLSPGTDSLRPGVVHRLDKDVSGLLVFAKTKQAEAHLIEQFKSRQVKRVYWAVTVQSPESQEGTVKTYISRHPKKRKIFISTEDFKAGGKQAITSYKVLKSHSGISWLECRLKTGRTHQIRLHLSSLKCPVIGDRVYGSFKGVYSFKNKPLADICRSLSRLALHARSLGFIHPTTKKELHFQAPWPEDIKELLKNLGFEN